LTSARLQRIIPLRDDDRELMPRAEYGRLLTEAYDLDKPKAPAGQLAFYLQEVDQASPPILASMCGSGRFLLPLLGRGIDADGVDASADMLEACRRKASEQHLEPALYEQALHELTLPRIYGLILIAGGGSIGLVADRDELREGLRRMYAHLAPGGRLLLEIEPPPPPRGRRGGVWHGRWWTRPNGDRIVLRSIGEYDPEDHLETGLGIYELYEGPTLVATELNEWIRRFWEPEDFSSELVAAGFGDIRLTRAFTDEELTGDEETVTVRCRKPA
jgi:SAM-dependent methyltransferase